MRAPRRSHGAPRLLRRRRLRHPRAGRAEVLQEVGAGRGDRAELRVRRRPRRPHADHRRDPPRPRAHRLRRQLLGQPRRALERLAALPARVHHRAAPQRRRLRRREEALPGDPRPRRALRRRGEGDLRLRDLRHRHDGRRRRGGLRGPRRRRSPIPVIPVNTPGFIGDKNIGNRLAGELLLEARHRHRRARDGDRLRRQPHRRVQHRRRPLGDAPAPRAARDPRPLLHQRRREVRGPPPRAPREAQRHHLLEEPHEPRAEDEEAAGASRTSRNRSTG